MTTPQAARKDTGRKQMECCNYCMWYGPIRNDGTMSHHFPGSEYDRGSRGERKQQRHLPPCEGIGKPYATFNTLGGEQPAAAMEPLTFHDWASSNVAWKDNEHGERMIVLNLRQGTQRIPTTAITPHDARLLGIALITHAICADQLSHMDGTPTAGPERDVLRFSEESTRRIAVVVHPTRAFTYENQYGQPQSTPHTVQL